ncbi:hypothetical protein [Streptomyces albiflavescens]|nr:hypothetical protein [Streptomyces albiflavescens]
MPPFDNCEFVEFDPAEKQPYVRHDTVYVVVGAPCPPTDGSGGDTTVGGADAGQDNGGQDAGQDNGGQDAGQDNGGQDAGQGGSSPASTS